MTTLAFPPVSDLANPFLAAPKLPTVTPEVAEAVTQGLFAQPKTLPAWLFYDEAGSRLFDEITALPEYYLTRTERAIFLEFAGEIIERAAEGHALQMIELGAGSCEKTRILLRAAAERQDTVLYEPVDVSKAPLEEARAYIENEIPGVLVAPRVADYARGLALDAPLSGERRLVLYIGSSIGNFEPDAARELLKMIRATLAPGDALLLGVDLVKDRKLLHAAYNDASGVTKAFNLNLLHRLNRELGANFKLEHFEHRAVWNPAESRMEMHLESRLRQMVSVSGIDALVEFEAGETIHTENSYKYRPGEAESMLEAAGFASAQTWTDARGWFAVTLGRAA